MFNGSDGHFYNEHVRRSVAIFGSLFNELYVVRRQGQQVFGHTKVPLSYGPQRKFITRIEEMINGEDVERQIAIQLPRMSFEILDIAYDSIRKLPSNNALPRCKTISADGTIAYRVPVGVPYNIIFQLSIYGKTHDDCLQVVEQILPYFGPQYTLSVYPFSEFDNFSEDNPVVLRDVNFTDDYEGDIAARRAIIYTLTFEMKTTFYGPAPTESSKVIRQVDVNLFDMQADSDVFIEAVSVRLNPFDVSPDSDYTYDVSILDSAQP